MPYIFYATFPLNAASMTIKVKNSCVSFIYLTIQQQQLSTHLKTLPHRGPIYPNWQCLSKPQHRSNHHPKTYKQRLALCDRMHHLNLLLLVWQSEIITWVMDYHKKLISLAARTVISEIPKRTISSQKRIQVIKYIHMAHRNRSQQKWELFTQ